ncbi:MAG TPA: T9SS type A sorting domain-containing protein [Bacteroidales bacterium]|nr:T9SS type A sorting domain-containing protein [Bacteroidales bacterium]
MKKFIFYSVLMLPSILWGQTVNHFDHADSKWYVAKTFPAPDQQNPDFVATTTAVYGFQGDTMINGKLWNKLYSTTDSLFLNDLVFRGCVRTENNKVVYLDTLFQTDTLYDFGLNTGDSVLFNINGVNPEWLKVIDIDSILLHGVKYRRLTFNEPGISAFDELNEIWIEGIGSIHGPLFPYFPVKFSQEMPDSMLLTCTFSNNEYILHNTSYTQCYANITLGIVPKASEGMKIYPNPFSEHLILENTNRNNFNLKIYDYLGRVVREGRVKSDITVLDLAGLDNGIYLLVICDAKNTMIYKTIKMEQR